MYDVIKTHGTATEVIRSFCTQSGAEDFRQWCDDHAGDYGDNPPTYCVVPQPITSTSIDVFDEFDLRQDTETTFSVHAHGATLATIVEHQDPGSSNGPAATSARGITRSRHSAVS